MCWYECEILGWSCFFTDIDFMRCVVDCRLDSSCISLPVFLPSSCYYLFLLGFNFGCILVSFVNERRKVILVG